MDCPAGCRRVFALPDEGHRPRPKQPEIETSSSNKLEAEGSIVSNHLMSREAKCETVEASSGLLLASVSGHNTETRL